MLNRTARVAASSRTLAKLRTRTRTSVTARGVAYTLAGLSQFFGTCISSSLTTLSRGFASLAVVLALSLAARADVKTLVDDGKISWANQAEIIYLLEGSVSTAADYDEVVIKFTDTATLGTFTVGAGTKVSVRSLVVGGGGAGGTSTSNAAGAGGGGGAGGFVDQTQTIGGDTAMAFTITVGTGGAAATSYATPSEGNNGNASSFIGDGVSVIANGGGGGGAKTKGRDGASGGGGSHDGSAGCTGGSTNVFNQGSVGGSGSQKKYGGGGGGAGAAGSNAGSSAKGGIGKPSDIVLDENGEAIYYAGGGGGGRTTLTSGIAGGAGGGGKGGSTTLAAEAGTDGLGGGGGGGGTKSAGGKGGDGVVILRIRDVFIDVPEPVALVWNDENQIGYEPKNYYEIVAVTGDATNATEAATYHYHIKPAGAFEWKDGVWSESSTETKEIEWTIAPYPVDIPATTNIVYDGTEHVIAADNWAYNVVGIGAASNAGNYSFTVSLLDVVNTAWTDGTTTDKTINWSIVAKTISKPTIVEDLVYSGTNSIVFTEYEGVKYVSGNTNSVNAGVFDYWVRLDNQEGYTNYVWFGESGDKSVENVKISWSVASQPVDVPEARSGLIYTGEPQNGFDSLDWSLYELVAGTTINATTGGTYKATFHLTGNGEADNYVWKSIPETTVDQTVEWTIAAKTNAITSLSLVGWRIGTDANTPTIEATVPESTTSGVVYTYGFGDDEESVVSWTNDVTAINKPGTWVLRAVIPETLSWTAATGTTTFVMWDDPGILYHNWTEIHINGTTTNLTNFVVSVRISEDRMKGFYYSEADSSKLSFVDELGNLLSYDVDIWNAAGESVVWVKLATLPTDGITVTMYWNLRDGQIAPKNTPTDVWSDYVGVWHMSEMTPGSVSIADASGHQNGTGHGSSVVTNGVFGRARGRHETPNTSGYAHGPAVTVPEYADLDEFSNGAFTISGWVLLRSTTTGWAYLFARKNGDTTTGWAAQFRGSNGSSGAIDGISFWRAGGSGQYYTFNTANKFSANTWAKYDFVRDGNTLAFYLNGSLVEKKTGIGTIEGGNQPFTIGGMNVESTNPSGTASTLNGYSDEVRLMPAAMSAEQIAADYTYQSDSTMITNGVVYLDGDKLDYWIVEPEVDKTSWDVTDSQTGTITNPGKLCYGDVTNYIYSIYDRDETYSSLSFLTNAGNYRIVFTQADTNGYKRIEKVFDIRVTASKPYTKIGGTNGNSGRVLLMNRDTNTKCAIDRQGYSDTAQAQTTFWQIFDADESDLLFNLKPGAHSILWTKNYGNKLWHLENCRHGNTYPKGVASGSLDPVQNYLPYSSTSKSIDNRLTTVKQHTVGQVVMRNMIDAAVYSPCYTNGIGTIYFDAVNGWKGITANDNIVVEIATNTVYGRPPTDADCVVVSTNVVEDEEIVTTNWYGNLDDTCWHPRTMRPFVITNGVGFVETNSTEELSLQINVGGRADSFYRVVVKVDYLGAIRFRIRRTSFHSGKNIDKYGLILLDNIIASEPAMGGSLESAGRFDEEKYGHETLGWELATSVPYPSKGDKEIYGHAKPHFYVNDGDGRTWNTNDFFQSATIHYRWRYLNQMFGPWNTVDLNPGNDFKAAAPFVLPALACDVEYWYDYRLQAPYYEYVDYSGIGKQIDYTEERGIQTNALSGTTLASGGTDWFFRVREGKSDYSGLDIVFKRGENAAPEREHMVLVDDHLWRGFVQTKENQAGTIYWRIEALDEQTEAYAEYAASTNYWYNEPALDKLPISGSLVDGGSAESWTELALDAASGYVMFQIDDSVRPKSLTVVHADYQNANGWTDALNKKMAGHDKSIFVGTSTTNEYMIGVSPSKQKFSEDFYDWGTMPSTNDLWTFPVGFADINHLYGRKAYETFASDTNGLWDVGQGMWVAKNYRDDRNGKGVALQMEGQGKGYIHFTDTTSAPRGIETISFNARLGQFVSFEDFSYYYADNILNLQNYTFMARTAFDLQNNGGFKGDASLSLIANYLPNKGFYEARWEWLGNNANAKRGQRLCLYRWNVIGGKKSQELIIARTNTVFDVTGVTELANNNNQLFLPMFISVSNDVSSKCTWVVAGVRRCGVSLGTSPVGNNAPGGGGTTGRNANWLGVCFKDTDETKRLQKGTYGVLSANCDGVFARPEFSHTVQFVSSKAKDSFENQALNQISNLQDIKNCAADFQDSEYPGWNIIPGRHKTTYTDPDVNAIMSDVNSQEFQIFLGTAGRADWGSTPYTNVTVSGFGGSGMINIPFYTTKDCSVRFSVAGSSSDVRTDVIVDSIEMRQWRGENWDDDDVYRLLPAWADDSHARSQTASVRRPGYTNFVFTSAWVTNNTVLMSARRTDLDTPCSIRAPLMDGYKRTAEGEDGTTRAKGLGMMSIAYANAQPTAWLALQISTNNTDWTTIDRYDKSYSSQYWTTVTNFDFSAMTAAERKKGVLNCYLGIHDVKGAMRIMVPTNAINAVAGESDTSKFGDVTITSIAASDEPALDVHSWWGWNVRTIGGDADSEGRMMLDDFSVAAGGAGLSVALNNSVSENFDESLIDTDDRESYLPHMPFVQTPTFTNDFIGEVSFKARKYSADDPTAAIVAYGSKNISTTDDGTWEPIDGAVFYVTNSWYETYSFKTPSETFRAVRLAVTGVEGVNESAPGGRHTPPGIDEPQRVLLDEICVCEAVLPRMGFKNVGCFRTNLSGTDEVGGVPSREQQPLCNEGWGVQCEVYPAQLASDIDFKTYVPRVRLHWFTGTVPWGFDKWKGYSDGQGHKSAWLSRATDTAEDRYVYRSSLRTSPDAVVSMSTVAPTFVQYMLEVVYYTVGGSVSTNWLSAADWQTPSWYSPLDFNADPAYGKGDYFAAYNILDNVAPGWAWINEVNIFGHFDRMKNTEEGKQFIEIAHPVEADITGWTVRLLEPKTGSDMVITNVLARFGSSGLKGTKALAPEDAEFQMVFRVLANEAAAKLPEFSIEDGTLDAIWKVDNPTTFFTKYGVISSYEPVGFQLVRTSGIVEHEILVEGTNFVETLIGPPTYLQDTRDFLESKMPGSDFVLPGYDWGGDGNSLSVTQNFGRCGMEDPTNDWSSYAVMSPGRHNDGQYINPVHPQPLGDEMLIYFTVAGDHIEQSLDNVTFTNGMFSAIVTKDSPTGTNVFYRTDPWYVLAEARTGTVSMIDKAERIKSTQPYVYRLNDVAKGIARGVTVVASAGVDPRISTDFGVTEDNPYRDAIIDWFEKGTDVYGNPWNDVNSGEIALAKFRALSGLVVTNLTLTEMYWLDMDPTVTNSLIGGMSSKPGGGPVVDEHVVTWTAGGTTLTLTNRRVKVYMMISNENDVVTARATPRGAHDYGRYWTPYVLRGLAPGSNSLGYGVTTGRWDSATFKITGMLMTNYASFDDMSAKVPLRHFVFGADSFGEDGFSKIEVIDPYSPMSWGYNSGWRYWWEKQAAEGQKLDQVMYFWTLDTRLPQLEVEMLKEDSQYGD